MGTLLCPLITVATADLAPLQPRTVHWGNSGSSPDRDHRPRYRTTPPVVENRGSIYDRNSSTDNYGTSPITPNPTPDYHPIDRAAVVITTTKLGMERVLTR
ncbi:MAG: hypothetical protein HC881_13925 [Leptolyngbyaceae cyanobacterium SL_7_1]|nr:hypothetical protein [Leptolyngbyaceae cyanobacterium SL_7_1]